MFFPDPMCTNSGFRIGDLVVLRKDIGAGEIVGGTCLTEVTYALIKGKVLTVVCDSHNGLGIHFAIGGQPIIGHWLHKGMVEPYADANEVI